MMNHPCNCPKCGLENSVTAQFCRGCGQQLTRNCPKCGKKVPTNAQYCRSCGVSLVAQLKPTYDKDRFFKDIQPLDATTYSSEGSTIHPSQPSIGNKGPHSESKQTNNQFIEVQASKKSSRVSKVLPVILVMVVIITIAVMLIQHNGKLQLGDDVRSSVLEDVKNQDTFGPSKNGKKQSSKFHTDERSIDYDWHKGPLAAVTFGMKIKDLPEGVIWREIPIISRIDYSGFDLRGQFIQWCFDRKHAYVPISAPWLTVLGVEMQHCRLIFLSNLNWDDKWVHEPDHAYSDATNSARLAAVELFPFRSNAEKKSDDWRQFNIQIHHALGNNYSFTDTPWVVFYALSEGDVVDSLIFKYVTEIWTFNKSIIEYVRCYYNYGDKPLGERIIIRDPKAPSPYSTSIGCSKTGVISAKKMAEFMSNLKAKEWYAGYGWVVEFLGHPMEDPNVNDFPYWPPKWSISRRSLIYIVDCGTMIRALLLGFDTKGVLVSSEIIPAIEAYSSDWPYPN